MNDRTAPRAQSENDNAARAASSPEPLPDDVIAEAWAALEAKRRAWSMEEQLQGEDFTTKILGGKWTRKHKGKAFDAIKSVAGRGAPSLWCRQYSLNVEASFSFAKYGEAAGSTLALQWCKVMQYYYNIFKRHNDSAYEYSEADCASLEEDADWAEFVRAAGAGSVVAIRAETIRALRPVNAPKGARGSAGASSSSSGVRR